MKKPEKAEKPQIFGVMRKLNTQEQVNPDLAMMKAKAKVKVMARVKVVAMVMATAVAMVSS